MTTLETPLPCPFCGGEAEFDHSGTCIYLNCIDCSIASMCEQISDHMSMKERLAMTFDENEENYGYPKEILQRVCLKMLARWNTRHDKAVYVGENQHDKRP